MNQPHDAFGTAGAAWTQPPNARRKRRGRILSSFLKLVFSLGLLAFVLNRIGWQQTRRALLEADTHWLIAALALALLSMVVRALRWKLLLDALDVRFTLARLTQLYLVGAFFSTFLPTGVGGDVVRAYEVAQQSDRPPAAVGTVLLDRATGLLMLLGMAMAALAIGDSPVSPQIRVALVVLTLLGWSALLLLMQKGLLERWGVLRLVRRFRPVADVYEAMHATGPRAVGGALGVSVALNLLLVAMNVFIGRALGVNIALSYFFLFVPIVAVLLMVPISLRGLGVREGAYVYLFGQAGVPSSLALTMGLLVYAAETATSLLGGILYAAQSLMELRDGDKA